MKRLVAVLVAVLIASCAWAGNPPMFQGNAGMFYYGGPSVPIVPVSYSTPQPVTFIASGASFSGVDIPVQVDQNTGAATLATYTVSVGAAAVTNIGQYLAGKQGVLVNAFGGDILMGNSAIASGTFYIGYRIASGTSATWSGMDVTATPTLYLLSNSGSAATATMQAW